MLESSLQFHSDVRNSRLIRLLVLTGMLLATWVILMQQGRINNDATLYLEMAKRFSSGDTQGALSLYNWPAFPWLMAKVHQLTGLSVQYAAHLLGVIFFGIATWSFLSLIHESGGNRTTLLAGGVLLFSAPYIVGDILPTILRDQGFWAFHLTSLLLFMRFYRSKTITHALLWQLSAALATLFRVEGAIFIVLLPLVLIWQPGLNWRVRLTALGKAWSLTLLGAAGIVAILPTMAPLDRQRLLGRFPEIASYLYTLYQQLGGILSAKAQLYGENVLGGFLSEYAMLGLILTLIAVLAGKILGASTWLAIVLAGLPHRSGSPVPNRAARSILYWAAGINLLNLTGVLLVQFVLTGRYAIPLVFIVLVFASFTLAELYQLWRQSQFPSRKQKVLCIGLVATLAFWAISNLLQLDSSRDYEQEAVAWIKQHAAKTARIYYDDARLRYYADAPWNGRLTDWSDLKIDLYMNSLFYDYLVLHIKHKHPERQKFLANFPQYRQIQRFTAKNGDIVLILSSEPSRTSDVSQ